MIKIEISTKGKNVMGTVSVHGDSETISREIYEILTTLATKCPRALENAIEMLLSNLIVEGEE